jgi:hypothetical protein
VVALAIGDDHVEQDRVDVDLLLKGLGLLLRHRGKRQRKNRCEGENVLDTHDMGNGEPPGAIPVFTTTCSGETVGRLQ